MFDDGDEELTQPAPRRRLWQAVAVLGAVVVVAGIVVGVARNGTGSSGPAPSSSAASSGSPTPVANGPVIPTFAPQTAGPDAPYGSSLHITLSIGKPRTSVTLYGQVLLLFASCLGADCRVAFHVPDAVQRAMRTAVPGCVPALNDQIRRRSGGDRVTDRLVLCKGDGLRVLVNIARVHSSMPSLVINGRGRQVIALHRQGPYTVQVIEQGDSRHIPDPVRARTLAADPRLLAGT